MLKVVNKKWDCILELARGRLLHIHGTYEEMRI